MESKKCGLSVIVAKVVNCTKVEDGEKTAFGSIGAAIWGSNLYKYYEAVLYKKPKGDYVSRIRINENFRFNVESEDTASVFSGDKGHWELSFMSGRDMQSFATYVGLARWISSDMKTALTQDVYVTKSADDKEDTIEPACEHGDYIEIYYVAKVITKDNKFGTEVANNTHDGKPLGLKIGTEWDRGLIGSRPGTKRLITIPNQSLGIWKCLVPNFQHLSLLVKVQGFGKSESDFNIWNPIEIPGPSIPTRQRNSRACRPGLITHLFKHGQNPPMRGAVNKDLYHMSQPFGIEQNPSIHPYKLLPFSGSFKSTYSLFEILTQMKVCNSKVKEFYSQMQISNRAVRDKIESCLKANLKLIHELEENFMEVNEQANVEEHFMRHPDSVEELEERLLEEAELDNLDIHEPTHPFKKTSTDVKVFTCADESPLPDLKISENFE